MASIVVLYQVSLIVGDSLEKKMSAYGANIIVSPRAEKLSVSYGGFHLGDMLYDVNELKEKETTELIRSIEYSERLSVVAPKLVTTVHINETPVATVGVRWDEELGIKSYWAIDGTIPAKDEEILLGARAAAKFGLSPGDTVGLAGKNYVVAGVLSETGGDDDKVIFMGLSALQKLDNKPDGVSFIEVAALCSGCPIDDIVQQLRKKLPGADIKALQSIVNQRMTSIHFVQKLALSISLVILITAAAMIGLSMLSAVNERRKDIGILRSLGYGKRKIFLIFCLEAWMIGAASGTVGYLAGYGSSFKTLEILALADSFSPFFSVSHLLISAFLFSMIATLASLYPAWKGAIIEPAEALVAM